MTSAEIRQSFLDFFKSKEHTIVPSSSLMPDSPNLLFTNAGMNQFVPIFLGQVKCPYTPGRAADTQKCIRAGGKHNDLDDVGLDTYHHTFFEMLGNWSFGDYFKKEAIEWAWELVVGRWKFPANRLYATVYSPDKSQGDPSEFDQEAWDHWAEKFRAAGLDPAVHIVNGNKKDNFWMMGDTGPCGPCSELHVDLTPAGDTKGSLVNKGDARCIEIWNLVFIQFNANPDGTFSPLPAKHVDTGMGFERVTSIIQGTKNFSDFANAKISNYETDIFRPIFDEIEKLSGKKYTSTLPATGSTGDSEQEKIDVAFRVIGDHIRTLSFAIADGIQPGNTDRNYVLRRILRRAVRYGRTLGFHEPFFYKLVAVLVRTMGDVFPEVRTKQKHVEEVLKREEEAFNKTLDIGLKLFENLVTAHELHKEAAIAMQPHIHTLYTTYAEVEDPRDLESALTGHLNEAEAILDARSPLWDWDIDGLPDEFNILRTAPANIQDALNSLQKSPALPIDHRANLRHQTESEIHSLEWAVDNVSHYGNRFSGESAFILYDTYGFPLDLTEIMAREVGMLVDVHQFNKLMEKQRARARAAQKKEVIEVSNVETKMNTHFLGYDHTHTGADVLDIAQLKEQTAVVLNNSVCYAEMGGQVGDTGQITGSGKLWRIEGTFKIGNTWLHIIDRGDAPAVGEHVNVEYDAARRNAIQRHHTVTHLLHWALHEVVSRDASQKGSFVGPDKLTFDFNSAALTPAQVRDVERLVNERIVENAGVSWTEMPYAEVKSRPDIMQFFGDKYGDTVRVVQIGGHAAKLDGYSMELCGGTHTRATGEIGLFRIVSEAAIAAGVRRIEAVAGLHAYDFATTDAERLKTFATKLNAPLGELEKKLDALLAEQKALEKALKSAQQREAAGRAKELLANAETINGTPSIIANLGSADGDTLQSVADAIKGSFKGVIVLGGVSNGAVALVASVSPDFTSKIQAGKIIQQIAPLVGGKGGGKPDNARGGGKDASKLDEALAAARKLLAN